MKLFYDLARHLTCLRFDARQSEVRLRYSTMCCHKHRQEYGISVMKLLLYGVRLQTRVPIWWARKEIQLDISALKMLAETMCLANTQTLENMALNILF